MITSGSPELQDPILDPATPAPTTATIPRGTYMVQDSTVKPSVLYVKAES